MPTTKTGYETTYDISWRSKPITAPSVPIKPDSSLPNKFNGNDLSNEINKIVEDLNIEKSKPVKVQCEIPQKITDEISQLLLNSSRTVELLQNHSHINQISMNASIIQLENEVSKLHEIRENSENRSHVTSRPDLLSGLMEFNMEEMSNNTKAIYNMVEAIASSTGWIPYIFHNLQFVEGQVNQTLVTSKTALKRLIFRDTLEVTKSSVKPDPKPTTPTSPNLVRDPTTGDKCSHLPLLNASESLLNDLKFVHPYKPKSSQTYPCAYPTARRAW